MMKKKLQKVFAMLLALSLVMSLMSVNVFAYVDDCHHSYENEAVEVNQVVEHGGTKYYDANGKEVAAPEGGVLTMDNAVVSLTKKLQGTDVENVFDITLEVETVLNMEEHIVITETPDSAVVLTIDLSGTMARFDMNGKDYIEVAKAAALDFIEEYRESAKMLNEETGEMVMTGAKRMLAIAGFDTDAEVKLGWVDVATDTGYTSAKSAVSNLAVKYHNKRSACGNYSGYYCNCVCTNFDGGVILTKNLLKQKSDEIDNCFAIVLSDGAATVTVSGDTDTVGTIKSTFWTGQGYQNKNQGGGWTHPQEVANAYSYLTKLKAETCTYNDDGDEGIFLIGMGDEMGFPAFFDGVYKYVTNHGSSRLDVEDTLAGFAAVYPEIPVASAKKCSHSGKPANANGWCLDCVLDAGNITTDDWLDSLADAVGGTYAAAGDEEELAAAFSDIMDAIGTSTTPKDIKSDAWTAIDPMGAQTKECIDFVKFLENDDSAVFAGGKIDWDLKEADYDYDETTGITTYAQLKYQVRLETEVDGFAEGAVYDTNKQTTFKYQIVENNEFVDRDPVDFPIPAVKGYLGEFSFEKTDTAGNPLAGAKFELKHDAACAVCGGAKVDTLKATSDENGLVTFDEIPSGHTYVMTETKAPTGDADVEYGVDVGEYEVEVAYGVTTVKDPDGKVIIDETNDGVAADGAVEELYQFENKKLNKLTVTKAVVIDNTDFDTTYDDASELITEIGDSFGGKPFEFVVTNSAGDIVEEFVLGPDGEKTIDKLPADTYTITEVAPEKDHYQLTVSFDGTDETDRTFEIELDDGDDETVDVTNTYKFVSASVTVDAVKEWDDDDDRDGKRPDAVIFQLTVGEYTESKQAAAPDYAVEFMYSSRKYPGTPVVTEIGYVADGVEYTGSIPGYTASGEGEAAKVDDESYEITITNSYEPELIDLYVEKTWDEKYEDEKGYMEPVTVTLWIDNGVDEDGKDIPDTKVEEIVLGQVEEPAEEAEEAAEGEAVLTETEPAEPADPNEGGETESEADIWSYTFEDLYRYADGEEIVYYVTEDCEGKWVSNIVEIEDGAGKILGWSIENSMEKKDPPKKDKDKEKEKVTIDDSTPPLTDIKDNDVPLDELEDNPIPLVPKTGDISALWLALSALSGTGLAGVSVIGRKKRED